MRATTESGQRTHAGLRLIAASLVVGVASVAVTVVPAQVASATAGITYYVNSTNDTGASATACMTNSPANDCGIDDAINAFNADTTSGDADTIVFNSSIATFTVGTPTTINNANTGVTLAITGSGASATAVSGAGTNQVFDIAAGTTVTISDLTIEHGNAPEYGGGILNYGTMTVTDSTLSGNTADFGGGILNWYGATTTVTDSTFAGNSAINASQGNGGGIYNADGTLTVTGSTLTGNSAYSASGGGGGIVAGEGTTTVTDSTLAGNTSSYAGGGILADGGTLTVADSTLSGNTAVDYGGGIFEEVNTTIVTDSTLSGNGAGDLGGGMLDNGDTTTVTDSTLSDNSAGSAGGGGIDNYSGEVDYQPGTTTLLATIVANSNTIGGDCGGTVADGGYNVDSDGTCNFSPTNRSISDSANLDASLGLLQDNGGPTETVLPSAASPAVGVIPNPTTLDGFPVCPRTDQRGVASIGKCTIGAVEGVFRIATTSLPAASPNTAFGPVTLTTQDAGMSASPYATSLKWKKVSLPKGLKLSPKTGVLSGTPSKRLSEGPTSIKVSVTETITTLNGKKKVKTKMTVEAVIPLTIT